MGDDIVVSLEDAVREPVVAEDATVALILRRCFCIAGVSQNGMTMPAPSPSAG